MSFALDQAFVQIDFKDTGVAKGLAGIKKIVDSAKTSFQSMSRYAAGFLAIAGAGAAYAVKEYVNMERQDERLRSALAATGQEVDANYKKLSAYADALKRATVYDESAIKSTMAFALNLGVTAENLEQVTKLGIGLSEAFGLSLEEGVRAAALAQQGNTRALRQMIPALKSARSEQDALNMVVKAGQRGFQEAEDHAGTLQGQLERLHVAVMDAAKSFGEVLAPQVAKVTAFATRMAMFLQQLTPTEKQQIVTLTEWAAALAGVIVFGPKIAEFAGTVLGAVAGMVKGIASLLVFLVTSPFGLVITGLAALAVGFAYAIGSGDDFVHRTIDGFLKIVDFLDHMLGSWRGFTLGMSTIWDQALAFLNEGWIVLKTSLENGWEHFAQFIEAVWWAAFDSMYDAWSNLKTGALKAITWLKDAWGNFTDWLGGKLAKSASDADTEQRVREKFARMKPGASEDEIQAEISKQNDLQHAYIDKQQSDAKSANDAVYTAKQKQLSDDNANAKNYMHQQTQFAMDESKKTREANRAANNAKETKDFSDVETKRLSDLKTAMDALEKLPTLSGNIKNAMKGMWDNMGLPNIDDLKKKFDGLKITPDKMDPSVDGLTVHSNKKTASLTGIEENFKKFSALRALGAKQGKQEHKDIVANQQLEEQKKANELHREIAKQAQITAGSVSALFDVVKKSDGTVWN